MTFLDTFTIDQVKEIIAQSKSISQALRLMGRSPHSGAQQYGVTFNTIRRWCVAYDLPDMKTKITLYSDDEWSQI